MERYSERYWTQGIGIHLPGDDEDLYGCEITDSETELVGSTNRWRSSKAKAYGDAWDDLMQKQKVYYSTPKKNYSKSTSESSYTSSSSDQSSLITAIAWLVGIGIAIFVIVWLAVNVVLPVALLNAALALLILSFVFKKYKTLFAFLALVGGVYMLLDITNGWLSVRFVENVVKHAGWISAFVYINAVAIGLCVWLLVQPIWSENELIEDTEKIKRRLIKGLLITLVTIGTLISPIVYHFVQNPFVSRIRLNLHLPNYSNTANFDVNKNNTNIESTKNATITNNQDAPPPPPPPVDGKNQTAINSTIKSTETADVLTIIIDANGKVSLGIDGIGEAKREILVKNMLSEFKIPCSPTEMKAFSSIHSFGVPINKLRVFLNTDSTKRLKYFTGIPINSSELGMWIRFARINDANMSTTIETVKGTPNSVVKKVISILQSSGAKYKIITDGKVIPTQIVSPSVNVESVKSPIVTSDVFFIVETMPSLPGGEDFMKFISKNTKYPQLASEKGIKGKVYVSWIVDTTGKLTNIKIVRGLGGGCDEEAIRLVKLMQKWNPGIQNGKSVNVQFNIGINFSN